MKKVLVLIKPEKAKNNIIIQNIIYLIPSTFNKLIKTQHSLFL